MIITAHTGQGFGGVLAYVYKEGKGLTEDEKPIILEQNHLFGTTKQQALLMRGVAMENSKSTRPVLHLTVSYPIDEKPTKEEVDKHLKEIIKEVGATAENNQYVIVAHRDSHKDRENKEEHYHIVINKVGFNGKNINTSYIQNKVHVIADKLEKQFDLKKTIGRKIIYDSKPENKKGWRYTTKKERADAVLTSKKEGKKVVVADKRPDIKIAKVAIAEKVKQALSTSKTPQELSLKLAEHRISVGVSVDKENNNAIRGISFKEDKIKVGGKEIGYSWQTINDIFHINQAKAKEIAVPAQTEKTLSKADPKKQTASQHIAEVQKNIADNLEKSHVQNIDKTNVQEPRQVPELAKNEEIKEKVPSQALSANDLLEQKKKANLDQDKNPGATTIASELIAKKKWEDKYFYSGNIPQTKRAIDSIVIEETSKLALEMKASMPKSADWSDERIADQAIRLSMADYKISTFYGEKLVSLTNPWDKWEQIRGKDHYEQLLKAVEKQKQGEIIILAENNKIKGINQKIDIEEEKEEKQNKYKGLSR